MEVQVGTEGVEEMFAISIDGEKLAAVEEFGAWFETAVWSINGQAASGKHGGVAFGIAVYLVSFGHGFMMPEQRG